MPKRYPFDEIHRRVRKGPGLPGDQSGPLYGRGLSSRAHCARNSFDRLGVNNVSAVAVPALE